MKILTVENIRILNEIGRWKAVTLQGLMASLEWEKGYSSFCRRIKKLEATGHVEGVFEKRNIKYLTLTHKGAALSIYDCPYVDSKESVRHDLICTNAIQKLVKFKLFNSGTVVDHLDLSIAPDGIIHASRYGEEYVIAIEVELHQKSKRRIIEKFIKYEEEEEFNHVLYITHKRSIFNAYRKVLIEMKKEVREKIILCLDSTLSVSTHNYGNAIYWMDGAFKSFQKMFGEMK